MDRFLEDVEWDPREIRPTGISESEAEQPVDNTPEAGLVPPEACDTVSQALDDAHAAVDALEQEAKTYLDEHLSVPTENRPITKEAVEFIAGTHPDYGTIRPEVTEEEALNADGKITGPVLERAYSIVERVDKNMLGFDVKDVIFGDEPGKGRPYSSVGTPAQAAGEEEPKRGDQQSVSAMREHRTQTERMSMWERVFRKIIAFPVRLYGKLQGKMGQIIENAISVRILGVSLNLGQYIAIPYYWWRDVYFLLAEWLMKRALGNRIDPDRPDVPEKDLKEGVNQKDDDVEQDLGKIEGPEQSARELGAARHRPNAATDNYSGRPFVTSAQKVLQATGEHVRQNGDSGLARALDRFETARMLKRDLDAHDDIAAAWGVDRPSDAQVPMPSDVDEDLMDAKEIPFVCPAPRS